MKHLDHKSRTSPTSRYTADLCTLTLLVGILALFYWGLLAGPSRIADDTVTEYYPGVNYFAKSIAAGRFPLWFPGVRDGAPFYSDTQIAVFYPLEWLLPPFVNDGQLPSLVYQRYIFLHGLLGAVFAYAFLKAIKFNPVSALAGALAFCLSGFFALRMAVNFVMIQVYLWLPLQLFFVHELMSKGGRWRWLGLVVAMAMSLLGGHPQTTVYCWYLVVAYWLYRGWLRERDQTPNWASALGRCAKVEAPKVAGTFVLVFGIAAVVLLPGAENWSFSSRSSQSFQTVADTSLPYRGLLRLLVPNFFGGITRQYGYNFWGADQQSATVTVINLPKAGVSHGFWQYWECNAYSGQAFWLAVVLIASNWRRVADKRTVGFFLVVWLAALWFMLGRYGGLFNVLYHVLPGVSFFRGPVKMSCVATFAAAVVVAYLAELVQVEGTKLRLWPAWLVAAGYAGFLVALILGGERFMAELRDWRKLGLAEYETAGVGAITVCSLLAIWAICRTAQPTRTIGLIAVLLVSIVDVYHSSGGSLEGQTIDPDQYYDTTENAPLSSIMKEGRQLSGPFRCGQLFAGRFVEEVGWHRNLPYCCDLLQVPEGYTSYYLDTISKFQSIANEPAKMAIQNIQLAISLAPSQETYSVTPVDCLPRAKFYSRVRRFESRTALLAALERNETDWRNEVAVWGPVAAGMDREPERGPPTNTDDEVRFVSITPEAYTIVYNVSRPGIVFISQAFYPGWIADGGRASIIEVFGAFQGLVIPKAGRGEITVHFSPPILKLALVISLLCAMIAILVAILSPYIRSRTLPLTLKREQTRDG